MEQQFDASKIGMWLFLVTEIIPGKHYLRKTLDGCQGSPKFVRCR
jgi:hypothetical protein